MFGYNIVGKMEVFCYYNDKCLVGIEVSLGGIISIGLYRDGFQVKLSKFANLYKYI